MEDALARGAAEAAARRAAAAESADQRAARMEAEVNTRALTHASWLDLASIQTK